MLGFLPIRKFSACLEDKESHEVLVGNYERQEFPFFVNEEILEGLTPCLRNSVKMACFLEE